MVWSVSVLQPIYKSLANKIKQIIKTILRVRDNLFFKILFHIGFEQCKRLLACQIFTNIYIHLSITFFFYSLIIIAVGLQCYPNLSANAWIQANSNLSPVALWIDVKDLIYLLILLMKDGNTNQWLQTFASLITQTARLLKKIMSAMGNETDNRTIELCPSLLTVGLWLMKAALGNCSMAAL